MPAFVLRQINPNIWRRFRNRADANGWPYRWVLLELIEAFADGRFVPTPSKPPFTERTTRKSTGPVVLAPNFCLCDEGPDARMNPDCPVHMPKPVPAPWDI